jgi:hypothetical protein
MCPHGDEQSNSSHPEQLDMVVYKGPICIEGPAPILQEDLQISDHMSQHESDENKARERQDQLQAKRRTQGALQPIHSSLLIVEPSDSMG